MLDHIRATCASWRPPPSACFGGQHRGDTGNARDLLDDLLRSLTQRLQLMSTLWGNGDRKVDAVVLDEDLGHETQIDDIAFEVRALDAAQLIENLRLRDGHLGLLGAGEGRAGRGYCQRPDWKSRPALDIGCRVAAVQGNPPRSATMGRKNAGAAGAKSPDRRHDARDRAVRCLARRSGRRHQRRQCRHSQALRYQLRQQNALVKYAVHCDR